MSDVRFSLAGKLAAALIGCVSFAIALALVFDRLFDNPWLAGTAALLLLVPLLLWAARRGMRPVLSMLRALAGTVTSYGEGDFSFGLHWKRRDELGELVQAHNALGAVLREQRMGLVQRELLLDTMVQNTPVAMLLLDESEHVIYANLAARKLLNSGRKLEGIDLQTLLESAPAALAEAIGRGGDGLFSVTDPTSSEDGGDDGERIYHLARRRFRLNGRSQQLFLLRHLTTELRRQEVQVWKKVIRVISHELNNSLAPVASLAHSGAELVRRGEHARLESVFATIEERARHLEGFIRGYAQFAKLPSPRVETVVLAEFLLRLHTQIAFRLEGETKGRSAQFDPSQLEQALLNLLRNAHESGSPDDAVQVHLRWMPGYLRIEVLDRGPGMPEAVLANALLPFYSTKRNGTGLGLALAREIVEAHGGRIALANRDGGGLSVALTLPDIA